jgi:N utilization substance protein B
MISVPKFDPRNSARSVARKLALQAIYRWQLNPSSWQELVAEFSGTEDMSKADREYFTALVSSVCEDREALEQQLGKWTDRTPRELDPVERAALLIGTLEMRDHLEVPYRVVINESVALVKRFGATDAHKFVNAVLDRGARELRPQEH